MLSLGDFMWVARRKASVVLAEVTTLHYILLCTVRYGTALYYAIAHYTSLLHTTFPRFSKCTCCVVLFCVVLNSSECNDLLVPEKIPLLSVPSLLLLPLLSLPLLPVQSTTSTSSSRVLLRINMMCASSSSGT